MREIIKHTLWTRRWSLLWWSLGVFGLVSMNLMLYPSFRDQAQQLQQSFSKLPSAAVQLLGGDTDFLSPLGFLNSKIYFFMLPLLLAVQAIGLGTSLIGREEQDHTLEMTLAQPVSRTSVLVAKAVAGAVSLLITMVVATVTTVVTAAAVNLGVGWQGIVLVGLMGWLLALTSGGVAYVLAASGWARGAAMGVAAGLALAGYIVGSLAQTVDWLQIPAKLLPFHYYRSEAILKTGQAAWTDIGYFVAVTAGLMALSWLAFRRRDLQG